MERGREGWMEGGREMVGRRWRERGGAMERERDREGCRDRETEREIKRERERVSERASEKGVSFFFATCQTTP